MGSGRESTIEEVTQDTEAIPVDEELDNDTWLDEYDSFQSQIATDDGYIYSQWEQMQETLNVFLNRCEGWRASEACQGQYGTKFQTCQNAIEKIWHMKVQHKKAEPQTKHAGSVSTGAEPRGMGGYASDLGQPPSCGAPLPGSTTYRFRNQDPRHED